MGQNFSFAVGKLSDKHFEEICRKNRDFKIEQNAQGELILMSPTLPDSGWRNNELSTDVTNWARKDKTGIVFDSSTYFTLPNGARRSPDVAWMKRDIWDDLTETQREKVSRILPHFVIELRSSTDSLKTIQAKMREYVENGVKLGWLIDPKNRKVYIYRINSEVEILDNPEKLYGEDVLKGFELNVRDIF